MAKKTKSSVENLIVELYNKGDSSISIAETLNKKIKGENWYPMKVRRIINRLSKSGTIQMRDKSEAQHIALREGRAKHPTEGRKRTPFEKANITQGLAVKYGSIEFRGNIGALEYL